MKDIFDKTVKEFEEWLETPEVDKILDEIIDEIINGPKEEQ